ncbi:MAG TPA: polyprenol phosphomannose-dependent alpha 1,6 mannosyltransferase MptB [Acidimicrobiales bacterium]|nr:polyprenol phosphomannose-dependent alpha 1,6 mannosyltransferase MptB [Acidimicrobiales bacterium]
MPPRPDTTDRSAATPGGLAGKAASGVVTERFVVTRRRRRSEAPWTVWLALGAAGAAGLAVCGGRVGALPVGARWWYVLPGRTVVDGVAFYGSLALLVVAWLGLGGEARRGRLGPGRAWAVLGAWGLPLVLGPPLFSRDLYSYVAQGLVAHGGHDPYTSSPSVLGPGPVLASVTAVWRSTPAPYGPLFVSAARGSAVLFGTSLTAEVVALRCLELAGVALVMVFLPRLARHHGVDPGVALWLGALSPLALLGCIASGHNDALMVGLVVAGVALVAEGRPGLGLVLCALAAAVKVPAAGAVVFVAVGSVRSVRGRARALALARAVVVPAATVGAVTAASGLGWGWLGPGALRVPTDVRVLQTPSVALGSVLGEVLSSVGVHVHRHAVVTVVQWTGVAVSAVVVLWLLAQVRRPDDVGLLGVALAAFVLLSPTVWPWYLLWGLVLLAATTAQRSRALALGAALAMLVVGPGGEPLLRGAGDVAVVAVVVAGGWWLVRRRRWATVVSGLR